MDAAEEIRAQRREEYNERQRILLSKLMSEKGGMLMKGSTDKENEAKAMEFFKQMQILDMKYIDIVREDWGLDPTDDSATFGDDLDKRWEHFIRNHVVKDEEGNPTILYKDKDDNYRLIPGKIPEIKDMQFLIDNYEKILLEDGEKEVILPMPSITIMGIEGVSDEVKYGGYNLVPRDKDFFPTQIMILVAELLDTLKKYKDHFKESNNELYKVLEEKYKEFF